MIRKALVVVLLVVGAVLFGPTAFAQYRPGEAGVVISPSTVNPGDTVTVQGFGCRRGEPVEVSIEGTVVARTVVDDNSEGTFQTTFTAPFTPGQYVVDVLCVTSGIRNQQLLTVLAAETTAATGNLPTTGSGFTLPLTKFALVLLAGGGLLVLAVRKRRAIT